MDLSEMSIIDHVRHRPGMYIGSLTQAGISKLILTMCQDLVDNSEANSAAIRLKTGWNKFEIHFSQYSDLPFLYSFYGKLNHMEDSTSAVPISSFCTIPVSKSFIAEVQSKSTYSQQLFEAGKQISYKSQEARSDEQFVLFKFELDDQLFTKPEIDFFGFIPILYDFAIMNGHIAIVYHQDNNVINLHFPEGIKNLSQRWLQHVTEPELEISIQEQIDEYYVEIELFFSGHIFKHSNVVSYANKLATKQHGSLTQGVIQGVCQAFEEAMIRYPSKGKLDLDKVLERINLVANVSMPSDKIQYCGNTKDCLHVPAVADFTQQIIYDTISKHFESYSVENLKGFLERFEDTWPWSKIEEDVKGLFKDQ